MAEIEAAGGFAKAWDFFNFVRDKMNFPSSIEGYFETSYFGGEFFKGTYKAGRKHGHGTLIYTNGDQFKGSFIADKRHGTGKMIFANGDIFTGAWKNDFMDGQGKYVQGTTGNTYVGGFKLGKKHGKGVMHYLVADDEQNLCQICYEGEIDVLFYDCGHVCSCQECAKQLDNCPVCRKSIIRVVKMWRS
jgi:hypothetical protein